MKVLLFSQESQKSLKEKLVNSVNKTCVQIDRIISSNKSAEGWAVGKKVRERERERERERLKVYVHHKNNSVL